MQEMQLVGIVINTAFLVVEERVFLPTVPQPGDDVVELDRALVTQRMVDVIIETKVAAFIFDLRGDQIPADASVADVIHGQEAARDIIRFVERRGGGRHQTDMRGDRRKRGDQRGGFQLDDAIQPRQIAPPPGHRPAARYRDRILEENHVEAGALGGLCQLHVLAKIHVHCWHRVRMPPAGEMVAWRAEKSAEFQLPSWFAHRAVQCSQIEMTCGAVIA